MTSEPMIAKELDPVDDNYTEVFIDQLMQVSNSEAVYEDFHVQIYFSTENLWDPTIIQNEELEASPLGSKANYRTKYIVSALILLFFFLLSDRLKYQVNRQTLKSVL